MQSNLSKGNGRTMSTQTDYAAMCGQRLGNGSFRVVYEHAFDDTLVIKVANCEMNRFHNWLEWMTWNRAPRHLRKMLAPIEAISSDGQYLIMRRADVVGCSLSLSDSAESASTYGRLRALFAEIRPTNVGMLDGCLVAVDYALMKHPQLHTPGFPQDINDSNTASFDPCPNP